MTITVTSSSPEPTAKPVVNAEAKVLEKTPSASEQSAHDKTAEASDALDNETNEDIDDDSLDDASLDADSKDSEKDKPKKKGGFQRRIDKLSARATAAQEEAQYWKEQALKTAGEPKTEPKVEKTEKVEAAGKPDPGNFDTHAEYVEALTDWKLDTREKAAKEKAAKDQIETEQSKLQKSHFERVESFKEKTSDFDKVLKNLDGIPVSPTIQGLILESENGPELMYALAQDRAEFEKINKLSPLAAARELGRLESKFDSSESKEEPKKITKAPVPIKPVGNKGSATEKSLDDPNLSQSDYEAIRRKQIAARTG